jgi:hypothetical protein
VRAEVLGVDEEDYTHYDNADRLIMQNRKLFLEMRPRHIFCSRDLAFDVARVKKNKAVEAVCESDHKNDQN